MQIARVENGVVVNVEVADAEWLAAQTHLPENVQLVPLTDDDDGPVVANIGLPYTVEDGFQQPPTPAPTNNDDEYLLDHDHQILWSQASWIAPQASAKKRTRKKKAD
jgi:hypothetical protein